MVDKKLFLLDAYALIFRAYYAFINRPIKNSKGLNTSAMFGFTNSLLEILVKEKPTHIAIAFDPPSPNFRHSLFPEYKANRQETPEDIKKSIPYIKEIIKGFNIPILEVNNYEADDVIGTVAKKASKRGFEVFMMTPDKDYIQLIEEKICMYKPKRTGNDNEIISLENMEKLLDISKPSQMIDVLALWGDASDNIPGAPGIGEKTAKKLIRKYDTLENLYNHINELQGKVKESLIENKEQILLSKTLVTIETNVPIALDIENFNVKEKNDILLKKVLNELEFSTIIKRIYSEEIKPERTFQTNLFDNQIVEHEKDVTDYKEISNVSHEYIVLNENEIDKLIKDLEKLNSFCFDTETTGLDVSNSKLVGLVFSYEEQKAYYIPIPDSDIEANRILSKFSVLFSNAEIEKIGQNLKFDIQMLKRYSLNVSGPLFDTMIAHYIIDPEGKHNLNDLAKKYLNYSPVSIETLIGEKGKYQKNMRNIEIEKIKEYAGEDADITLQLYKILRKELEINKLEKLAYEIEMPLITVLAEMENNGFTIDNKALHEYSLVIKKEIEIIHKEIYKLAGTEFNISSPKQLGEILFDKLQIAENAKMTKTKQYSTSEETLLRLYNKHEIIPNVLEYRSLTKLISTYISALPNLINPVTKKIHTSFEQAWVSTGRLSSKNPNLQNIPVRDKKGREIRKSFIASGDEYVLLSADYSQIELRIMAHLSDDENMIEAFKNDEDIHRSTAAKIFKVRPDEVTGEMRNKAKTANFGIIYGISAFGLAQRLNISRTDAKELIEGYFKTFRDVLNYINKSVQNAREKGYVETIMGRKRFLKDIRSSNSVVRGIAERNAINAPIQGSAADIIKKAMVAICKRMEKLRSKMILQVHDELIFDVYIPELEELKRIVKTEMENAVQLKVPLKVEMGTGKNWLEAH